jgi:hypothetical protein
LFPAILNAQVKIQERIEIQPHIAYPQTPKLAKALTQTAPILSVSTISYKLEFTGSIRTNEQHDIGIESLSGCFSIQKLDFTGSQELTVPISSGITRGGYCFYFENSQGAAATQTWSIDGVPYRISSGTGTIEAGLANGYDDFGFSPGFSIFTGLESTFHGCTAFPILGVEASPGNDCQTGVWIPEFGMQFTITEGQQYGQFIDGDGNKLGISFSCIASELANVGYIADGITPSERKYVTVEASCTGITKQISFRILPPVIDASIYGESSTSIEYQSSAGIDASLQNTLEEKLLTFEIIDGTQYATLQNAGTEETGTHLSGILPGEGNVTLLANGVESDVEQVVRVQVSADDHSAVADTVTISILPIAPEVCPVVKFAKEKIAPGDTVGISITGIDEHGVPIAYPADAEFTVWMNSDDQYGTLLCAGNTGWMVSGPQPFKFIAAGSIDVDSTVVEITAIEGGGISSSVGTGITDRLPEGTGRLTGSVMTSEQTVSENKNTTNKEQRNVTVFLRKLQLQLKKENAVNGNENQKERLTKLIEKVKALAADKKGLANTGTTPSFSQAELRDIAVITASIMTMCTDDPTAQVIIKEGEPELELDYPTEDQIIEGNTAPVWTKPIRARLVNYNKGDVTFYWDMNVEWNGDAVYTPIAENIYQGIVEGTINDNWADLEIKTDHPLLGGDQVTLHVKAVADGKAYETNPTWKEIFKIKGKNPSRTSILSALGDDKYKAIAYHETGFNQFHKRKYIEDKNKKEGLEGPSMSADFPYQGIDDPRDIGIMQISNPKEKINGDAIVWDWTVNVRTGKDIFDENYIRALSYLKKISGMTNFTQEQLLKETYCGYNRYKRYWEWDKGDAKNGIAGMLTRGLKGGNRAKEGRNYADKVYPLYTTKPWNNN